MSAAHLRTQSLTVWGLLAAAADAGLNLSVWESALAALSLPGKPVWRIEIGEDGWEVELAPLAGAAWSLTELEACLAASSWNRRGGRWLRDAAARWLGEDRAGRVPAEVLAQLAAVVAAWQQLGIAQTTVAALPLCGNVDAVADLLVGFQMRDGSEPVRYERAAVASVVALGQPGLMPEMTLQAVGRSPDGLELWLGQANGAAALSVRTLLVLETNIDDMNPEFYDHVLARCLAAGALDVYWVPMQMKKNRPAILLRALCAPPELEAVRDVLFAETTTLGVRVQPVTRYALPRRYAPVRTPWGVVQVKIAQLPDGSERLVPEYDDCRRLAAETAEPVWRIYQAAQGAAQSK